MKNKKHTGSFYTPKSIASFLVDYLYSKIQKDKNHSILEPSAGDGVFIKELYCHDAFSKIIDQVVAVELNKEELEIISDEVNQKSLVTIHADFLDFQKEHRQKFSLVIGNPPYIKKSLLSSDQISNCKSIHASAKLSSNSPKNIWTSFLVRSIAFTKSDGILSFVLPSELLQVTFAKELRDLLLSEFERVEVFTFNELLFDDCKGQDTILLIAERTSEEKGLFFCNVKNASDLKVGDISFSQNTKVKGSKWSNYFLESDEIELLEKFKENLFSADHYCYSKPGIVTAANDYFIVNHDIVKEFSLENFVKPIIQKGALVNGSAELRVDDFQKLINNAKPTFLISIDNKTKIRSNSKFWKYKEHGEKRDIHLRYKTSLRTNWYEVPNIGTAPEAFFFKRSNEYPKLIKNSAGVLATDSAYIISMKENYKIESLIFSFYNSLTLAFSELYGRFYGGGVLELTPNEFKQLPVPYLEISQNDFTVFLNDFRNKTSIKDVCHKYDEIILKSIDPNIEKETIDKLFSIREKLFSRRIKSVK